MSKEILVISRLHLSEETKGIQSKLEGLEIGESVEAKGNKYTKVEVDACEVEAKVYSSNWDDYKFSKKDVIGSYTKVVNITPNDIETVIVNCMEGGSNYWMGLDNTTNVWQKKPKGIPLSTWATQMLLEGETIHFYDIEDEETTWTLTLDKLVKGFMLNAERRPFDCDLENGDATTSDCIIQYAMMGEIVYG